MKKFICLLLVSLICFCSFAEITKIKFDDGTIFSCNEKRYKISKEEIAGEWAEKNLDYYEFLDSKEITTFINNKKITIPYYTIKFVYINGYYDKNGNLKRWWRTYNYVNVYFVNNYIMVLYNYCDWDIKLGGNRIIVKNANYYGINYHIKQLNLIINKDGSYNSELVDAYTTNSDETFLATKNNKHYENNFIKTIYNDFYSK